MSQIEKLIEKMRNQPNGIRPEEADRVLNAFGYNLKPESLHLFAHPLWNKKIPENPENSA